MTRGDIKNFARALMQESEGAPGLDPVILDMFVDQAVNEICRATGCYYLSYTADLANGQQSYCAPPLYEIRRVYATLSDGRVWPLHPHTAKQMDAEIPLWQWDINTNQTSYGDPLIYVPDGLNAVRLWPVPNYSLGSGAAATATLSGSAIGTIAVTAGGSGYLNPPTVSISDPTGTGAQATATISEGAVTGVTVTAGGTGYSSPTIAIHTGGLTFEGLAVPDDSGTSLWPSDSDEAPIPVRGHVGIAYKVASLRMLQRAANDPSALALGQQYERMYAIQKGYIESEAARYTDATKYRACVGSGYHWAWGGVL